MIGPGPNLPATPAGGLVTRSDHREVEIDPTTALWSSRPEAKIYPRLRGVDRTPAVLIADASVFMVVRAYV